MVGHLILCVFATVLSIAFLWPAIGYAAPPLIHFQGVLRDLTGAVVDDDVYALKFRIYNDSVGGAILWETAGFLPLQTTGGIFNHLLGSTNSLPDSVFQNDNLWVGVSVDLDPEMAPRTRLAAVPFAMQANSADTARSAGFADTAGYALTIPGGGFQHGSMFRAEDTVTVIQSLPGSSQMTLKQITINPGQVGHLFRVSMAARVQASTQWGLYLYADGQWLCVYGESNPRSLLMQADATRLDSATWYVSPRYTLNTGGSPGGIIQPLLFDTIDVSDGLVIEVVGVATSGTVDFTIGTVVVEYDVD